MTSRRTGKTEKSVIETPLIAAEGIAEFVLEKWRRRFSWSPVRPRVEDVELRSQ